jgi:hypothetical protein
MGSSDVEEDETLQDLDCGSDDEGEFEPETQEDLDDEIDPAVERHDTAEVMDIVNELELAEDDASFLDSLTPEQVNLGQFSIAKVRSLAVRYWKLAPSHCPS